jgi:hypothetical protein
LAARSVDVTQVNVIDQCLITYKVNTCSPTSDARQSPLYPASAPHLGQTAPTLVNQYGCWG